MNKESRTQIGPTIAFRVVAFIAGAPLAVGLLCGCSQVQRKAAQDLAKQSIGTTQDLATYQLSVTNDQARLSITKQVVIGQPATYELRSTNAALLESLQRRSNLASSLHDLATKSSDILNFSSDDAKTAARSLVSQIETIDHHPVPSTVTLPAGFSVDPQAELDKAVSALVEVRAVDGYQKVLPKIRDAVSSYNNFFETERPAYIDTQTSRLQEDEIIVEHALKTSIAIDLSVLQPSLDTFGLKSSPSSIGSVDPGHLAEGVHAAITEMLLAKVAETIGQSAKVSNEMTSLEVALCKATNSAIGEPGIHLANPSDPGDDIIAPQLLANELLARIPVPKVKLTTVSDGKPLPKFRESVLRRLATRLTKQECRILAQNASDARIRAIVAPELTELMFGVPLVQLPKALQKSQADADVPPELDAETSAVVIGFLTHVSSTDGSGSKFYFTISPAGRALAWMNRRLIEAALPELIAKAPKP